MADHEPITGTGLGLPIARDLARAMGGELEVASLSGIGSSFVLVLPGPAGPIPAAAMAGATRAAVASETDYLRTMGLLRAGVAATASSGHDDDLPLSGHDDERDRGRGDDRLSPPEDRAPLPAGFRR